jgi:glycosyltransferase involved in cell wall biosynthesis
MTHISIVAPVHNELRDTLHEVVRRVGAAVAPISEDYEIILVDDGSENDSWDVIHSLACVDPRVCGIRLSRNFGQHIAISAGLDDARGDWVVVMDSDLQDRPEVIPDLYTKAQQGYDVVFVNRVKRPEPLMYRIWVGCFFALLNLLSGQEYNRLHGNFSIVSAAAVRASRSLREPNRFYGGVLKWVGFRHASIDAQHGSRIAGQPSYTLMKRARFGFDLIVGFSTRLLYVSVFCGLLMALASVVMASYVVVYAWTHSSIPGWPSVMTAVLFTAGVTNVAIGLIGVYIAQIIQQTKSRPLYIVAERIEGQP